MNFQKYEIGLGTWVYNVELSKDEGDRLLDKAVNYVRKDVSVPGYRKGNVPNSVLFSQFGDKINGAFREFLVDTVLSELKKEHTKTIESYVLLDLKPGENEAYLVTIKVSEPTEIFFSPDDELKNDIKSINFVKYSVDEENFSISEEIEEVLKSHLEQDKEINFSEGNKYVVGLEFKFKTEKEELSDIIDIYVNPKDDDLKGLFDGKNTNDKSTIKLNSKLKKIIKDDYISNFIGVSEEAKLDDNVRIVYIDRLHSHSAELQESLKDPKNVAKYFNIALDLENHRRLENRCISYFVKKYGFSLNEDDFVKELYSNFDSTIYRLRRTPTHVFVPYIDIQLIKQQSLNNILQREFYKELYKRFFNLSLNDENGMNEAVKNVLQKLYESVNLSTVKVSSDELLKDKIYIFANIIKNIANFM
jgi:hypothetical protein